MQIYFRSKIEKSVITIFNFEVCSTPGPSFSLACIVLIDHLSINWVQGVTYLEIKNDDDPIFGPK